jgi:hypothetical protein
MMHVVRRLRFFPDYGADPLWDAGTGSMISLDTLPVQPETREAIRRWSRRWEVLGHQQMTADAYEAAMADTPADPVPEAQWRAIEDEGRKLCRQLQGELGSLYALEWEGT